MKKLSFFPILFVLLFLCNSVMAQDTDKSKFHFGLKAAPALSWFVPSDKNFTNDGSKIGFGYGLMTEFNFSKNYAFSTGLEILNAGGKIRFPKNTLSDKLNDQKDTFIVTSTSYGLRYINLPLLLKLKTNQIGAMTYFGQFGFDVSFKWRAIADNEAILKSTAIKMDNVNFSEDINFVRLALNVGLGAEYNLTGSTSLVFSVNYNNGFTNAMVKKSKILTDVNYSPLIQKSVFNYVGLTIGVLF
ncbi:MAG TPA: porin family protein [Bacteroidales bacterium]|nr:porin family protein [Bacteroidales bacterium]HQI45963.1 porin family protein [Bacteroidales bacterium]